LTAPLVYLFGPSGVGKDSILAYARARLAGSDILFAHRYVTRPLAPDVENFVALTPAEFARRRELGLFAMSWSAHGLHYGVGCEIEVWREHAAAVVVSGSRAHFRTEAKPDWRPVLVTARPEIIAQRLAQRGREDEAAIAERLARGHEPPPAGAVILDNSGPLAVAGEAFISLLKGIATETAAAP
jgi:ribose 1,5-bisphosphokinase